MNSRIWAFGLPRRSCLLGMLGAVVTCTMVTAEVSLSLLPGVPGGDGSVAAYGISDNGSVIAGYTWPAEGTVACVWNDGDPTALGDLTGGQIYSVAMNISSNGQRIVGHSDDGFGYQAVLWEGTSMTQLPDLPGGYVNCAAMAISGDGTIIVGYGTNSDNHFEATRWVGGVAEGLGNVAGNQYPSFARGISADGKVIVGWAETTEGQRPFRYENGTMSILSGVPVTSFYSYANDANANGSVIVGQTDSNAGYQAFYWTSEGLQMLDTLPGGFADSTANAVNGDGSVIVGYATNASYWKQAVAWMEKDGYAPVALDDLLDSAGVDRQGFSCWEAFGVSQDGLAIVGYGYIDQATRAAFVVTLDGIQTWGSYPVTNGWVDTGNWLGQLHVADDPYIWSDSQQGWLFIPPETRDTGTGWMYVPR